jgi:hypothetical protein
MEHLKTEGSGTVSKTEDADNKALEAKDVPFEDPASQDLKATKEKKEFEIKEAIPKTPKQLVIEEERVKGAIDTAHWWDLKKSNGDNLFWSGLTGILIISSLAPVAERKVLE